MSYFVKYLKLQPLSQIRIFEWNYDIPEMDQNVMWNIMRKNKNPNLCSDAMDQSMIGYLA